MNKSLYVMLFWVSLVSLPAAAETSAEFRHYVAFESAYSWNIEPAFDRRRPESGVDLFAMEQRRALFTAGLQRKFNEKLSLDLGVNRSQTTLAVDPIDYEDFYLGVNYGSVGGRVWYRDQANTLDDSALYYEAGWFGSISDGTSISLQFGQEFKNGRSPQSSPDLSISAQTQYRGYNFGVRVIDHSGFGLNGEQDFSLIGSFQKRFP